MQLCAASCSTTVLRIESVAEEQGTKGEGKDGRIDGEGGSGDENEEDVGRRHTEFRDDQPQHSGECEFWFGSNFPKATWPKKANFLLARVHREQV